MNSSSFYGLLALLLGMSHSRLIASAITASTCPSTARLPVLAMVAFSSSSPRSMIKAALDHRPLYRAGIQDNPALLMALRPRPGRAGRLGLAGRSR